MRTLQILVQFENPVYLLRGLVVTKYQDVSVLSLCCWTKDATPANNVVVNAIDYVIWFDQSGLE